LVARLNAVKITCADDPFDDGRSFLIADVAVECHTSEHANIRSVAWVALVVYAFGLVVFDGSLLFSARKAIAAGQPTRISKAIGFLYREYEPWCYWCARHGLTGHLHRGCLPISRLLTACTLLCARWELMEMMRRLCLVGIFVLVQRGSFMQLIVGCAFCALYLLLQMQAAPYKEVAENYLANICSFSLLIIFLFCLIFKVSSSPRAKAPSSPCQLNACACRNA
jgi:hypothetical protein